MANFPTTPVRQAGKSLPPDADYGDEITVEDLEKIKAAVREHKPQKWDYVSEKAW